MVEPLSVDDSGKFPDKTKQSSMRSSIFNAYLFLTSLCAIIALVIAAVSLHKANEGAAFTSSLFMTDMERTFNSTVYAIANRGPNAPACDNFSAEVVTGQTSIPGQCVTVADSYSMWVTRLAQNCVPYAYAQENCTGTSRMMGDLSLPDCIINAAAGELAGKSGETFRSFQILCT
ncbi:uncharacterized protein N7482_007866 [Penicillium canariense]|uniref:Uncharacterized protein n=1 Tax=Penicillium canariense TaxID=189055 RepID=A0A9W9LJK8_9EURO|nr:uncharacterized protein N7482_007866 [Penicillium canariense]KAJ5160862.1 hypothetical protein N7482_007866 [Penicillium canariense]